MIEGLMVVKIGGAKGICLDAICEDVRAMQARGLRLVIVHGGSEGANQLAAEMGHGVRFLYSPSGQVSRYTDRRMRDIYVKAVKAYNAEIVAGLSRLGVPSLGLTLADSCVLLGERRQVIRAILDGRERVIRDDYTGRISALRLALLQRALELGQVPVMPPMAYSPEDGFLNVDGDRAAAAIAAALEAEFMILLSNVSGLYQDYIGRSGLVHEVPRHRLPLAKSWAQGRMKRKILSVEEALNKGVTKAAIADGRGSRPLQSALAGGGTWFS